MVFASSRAARLCPGERDEKLSSSSSFHSQLTRIRYLRPAAASCARSLDLRYAAINLQSPTTTTSPHSRLLSCIRWTTNSRQRRLQIRDNNALKSILRQGRQLSMRSQRQWLAHIGGTFLTLLEWTSCTCTCAILSWSSPFCRTDSTPSNGGRGRGPSLGSGMRWHGTLALMHGMAWHDRVGDTCVVLLQVVPLLCELQTSA